MMSEQSIKTSEMSIDKQMIRTMVRNVYAIQKLRIQFGNRIAANFRASLGQTGSMSEDELEKEKKDILDALRSAYKRITDGINRMPTTINDDGPIDNFTQLMLMKQYTDLEKSEEQQFRQMQKMLKDVPIYREFLAGVKGVGPAMAGVIISEIDIHRAEYPSSVWKYAGLDVVVDDNRGRSKRKEHLVKVKYKDREGEEGEKLSITFNPFLKTKLIGVLGSSFLRAGDNKYSQIYREYKHRLENHPKHQEKTKAHRHNMAIRKMIKQFLVDLYNEWRRLEGLPVAPTYAESKLGMVHGSAEKYDVK